MQINSFPYTRNNCPKFTGKIHNTPDLERLKNSLSARDYVNLNKQIKEIESIEDGREFYYATNTKNKKDVRAEIWEIWEVPVSYTSIPLHRKIIDAEEHQYKWVFDTLQRHTEFHKENPSK